MMWKEAFKGTFDRIVKEMYAATGVSDGDYMVLDLLTRAKDGGLRQQELTDAMGWTKSRLSHHLTRMEKRGLVVRRPLEEGSGVRVSLTPGGRSALDMARPVIEKGIKTYFIDGLTGPDVEAIARIAERAKRWSEQSE